MNNTYAIGYDCESLHKPIIDGNIQKLLIYKFACSLIPVLQSVLLFVAVFFFLLALAKIGILIQDLSFLLSLFPRTPIAYPEYKPAGPVVCGASMQYPVCRTKAEFNRDWYVALGFGAPQPYGFHEGSDINLRTGGDTDLGKPLYAIADGEVSQVDKSNKVTGFGNELHYKIEGSWGVRWVHYAHCQSITVKVGDKVKAGQQIATIGKSGRPRNELPAHVHAALKKQPSGIGNVANTLVELNQYWEDLIAFIEKYQSEDSETCVAPEVFEKLVHNSTLADSIVKELGLAEKADAISFETVQKSLNARDGKLTSCTNVLSTREKELATAQSEVSNRIEQVGRLEDKLLRTEVTYKAEIDALKEAQTEPEELLATYESTIEQLESKLDLEAKAKGKALTELAEVQAELEQAKKEVLTKLTVGEAVQIIIRSIFKKP